MTNPNKNQMEKLVFCFNPERNGGESLHAIVEKTDNGGQFSIEFKLNSYGNVACIYSTDVTPEKLRQLADKIEDFIRPTPLPTNNNKERRRPASIEALMSIDKSDQEIQSDLQTAFTNVAHVTRQR